MPKKPKKEIKKYPTFNTSCYQCDKPLRLPAFNASLGAHSFALCPKHLQQAIEHFKLWD